MEMRRQRPDRSKSCHGLLRGVNRTKNSSFSDLSLTPIINGEFADSSMMKIAGWQGLGLFAIPESIREEITTIYGLQEVGVAEGVKERFYAMSVERKLKHSEVVVIRENATQG